MPISTLIIVVGSWALLGVLTVLAYRFNSRRSAQDEVDGTGKVGKAGKASQK